MTGKVFYLQLLAVKHLCLALVPVIDSMLDSMDAQAEAAEAAATADAKSEVFGGPCQHPVARRIPIPAMGPRRFKCMDCNQDVLEEGTGA
jgi:hypothetical protein